MGKTYIVRYGAYGDMMYLLPTFDRLRSNGEELFLFTGLKGKEIFLNDHRFGGRLFVDEIHNSLEEINKLMEDNIEKIKPDTVLHLDGSLEGSLIFRSEHEQFHLPVEERRKLNEKINFYDVPMILAEVDNPPQEHGECGSMSYHEDELTWAEGWRERFKDKFIVCMPLQGSMGQKRSVHARAIAKEVYEKFPDAVIFPMGDPATLREKRFSFGNGRTFYPNSFYTMRQSILMTRYADFVIGPETGILVGAGMWGTPKTMLCTSSSVSQCVGPQKNDFSMQADLDCSPCMRAIYGAKDCEREKECLPDDTCPCNFKFDLERILDVIGMVHREMRYVRDLDGELRTQPIRVSEVQAGILLNPGKRGNLQQRVPGDVQKAGGDGART